MKYILAIAVCLLLVLSCKKEATTVTNDQYLTKVKEGLTDSLSAVEFQKLDFSRALVNRVDSIGMYVARVPFKTKAITEDFVTVKTDAEGNVRRGRIVHLEINVPGNSGSGTFTKHIGGVIVLRSLSGVEEIRSPIDNGYITAFHKQTAQRTSLQMASDLPEVVIVGIRHLDSGISFSTWCMVQTFFMDFGGGGGGSDSWGGYYGSLDGGGGPSGGGGSTGGGYDSGGNGPSNDPTYLIDLENQDRNPAINIQKYINCFTAVPDAGAKCTVEIMTDIPVDNNPNAFFDIDAQSPGHVFLSLSKSNGSQHVTQNIGFYPASGYKAFALFLSSGKLVNNAGHEFNASLSMEISPAQLSAMLNQMLQSSSYSYDVELNNCTDWALSVFNLGRTTPLEIPRYPIPTSSTMNLANSPQGLYKKLQEMVAGNDPEKGNVTIGIIKGYAGGSNGPCN